jgi:phosphotransferase system enzyme I (PtsI)
MLAAEYSDIARRAGPGGVIFRTFDIGGDKVSDETPVEEPNPFLGWRGIRISLDKPALFRRQLRAILRASAHGKVRVMFPMVASLEELLRARHALATAAGELEAAGLPYDNNLDVGSMIEIPSAAMISDLLATHVDFFSLGTNDLVQYTLAVDRMNERVAGLYQPTHPAVLRLIHQTVSAGHRHGKWVGICGEMASDVTLLPLLAGLEIDEFSVAPSQVARVRYALRRLHIADCRRLALQSLHMADASSIHEKSRRRALKDYPELLL